MNATKQTPRSNTKANAAARGAQPEQEPPVGATYVATVTSGAEDSVSNALDQNSTTAGNQNKSWKFKVG